MKDGGFDCVIGNPPWGYKFSEYELTYLRQIFRPIIVRMIDSFMFFVAKACGLLRPSGRVGMIVPDVLLYQVDNLKLRELLLATFRITNVVNLGDRVFFRVTRPSCIFAAHLRDPRENKIELVDVSHVSASEREHTLSSPRQPEFAEIKQSDIALLPGKLLPVGGLHRYAIWFKVKKNEKCIPLVELVDDDGIQRGVSPDLKEAFVVDAKKVRNARLEKTWLRKVLLGGDIKRYGINYADRMLLYLTGSEDPKQLPHIRDYISQFKNRITCTEVRDRKHSLFALHRAREERIFLKKPKLVGVITEDEPILARDDAQLFVTDGAYLFGVRDTLNCNYLLGIMNSRLMRFLYRLAATETNRVLAQVKPAVLGTVPVFAVNFADPSDKLMHDRLVNLVGRMLELSEKKHSESLAPSEPGRLEREIAEADTEIDDLVFKLYGITDEERKIIEGSAYYR